MSVLEWIKWILIILGGLGAIAVYWIFGAGDESWYVKIGGFIAAHGFSAGGFYLFVNRLKHTVWS
jgi:hypothetical protein